ncbi:MAG: PspA/IM30 family protein, partial [Oceanococcaceae bacterium]
YSRLSDIVNSNLHSMLDRAEDPEKMIRLAIGEMEDTLVELRSSAVSSISRRKQLERERQRLRDKCQEWEAKAELALGKDREDLARQALVLVEDFRARDDDLGQELAALNEALEKIDTDVGRLNDKLRDAKARQKTLLLRQNTASVQLKAKNQINDDKIADAVARFEAFERKVDDLEARSEAQDVGRGEGLEKEFADLEREDVVEERLTRMKARLRQNDESDTQG